MTTVHLRRLVLVGAMGAAALTLGTAGAVAASPCGNSCWGDEPGEPGYDEDLAWLDQYEEDQETTYGESDGSLYPESENGVKPGPNGEGDKRPGTFPLP